MAISILEYIGVCNIDITAQDHVSLRNLYTFIYLIPYKPM